MDSRRFDRLAKGVAGRADRRGALLALLAAAAPAAARAERDVVGSAGKACRYPGLPCRSSAACCARSACEQGRCRCKRGLVQCGDFCVTEAAADAVGCRKPYKSACAADDPLPCCGLSACTGVLGGKAVCCGLEIHPCTQRNRAYCCSGACGPNGRCLPPPQA